MNDIVKQNDKIPVWKKIMYVINIILVCFVVFSMFWNYFAYRRVCNDGVYTVAEVYEVPIGSRSRKTIEAKYFVNGKEYKQGCTYRRPLKVGDRCLVKYNPSNPHEAFLLVEYINDTLKFGETILDRPNGVEDISYWDYR